MMSITVGVLMALIFVNYPFVLESPRWLLSQANRTNEAEAIFTRIAKVNSKPIPANLRQRLDDLNQTLLKEPKYGVITLFSRWGIAVKSTLLMICFTTNQWIYKQLFINLDNIEGSYFLNLFMMSVVEVPACFLGVWLAVS